MAAFLEEDIPQHASRDNIYVRLHGTRQFVAIIYLIGMDVLSLQLPACDCVLIVSLTTRWSYA